MQTKNVSSNPDPLTLSQVFKVRNKMGIHARPAAMIVRLANQYTGTKLWIATDAEQVDGKSIMGLMVLGAGEGSDLKVTASGEGANALLKELEKLFERQFDEA